MAKCEIIQRQEIRGFAQACREMGYSRVHIMHILKGTRESDLALATIAYTHGELLEMFFVPDSIRETARILSRVVSKDEILRGIRERTMPKK